jgi:1-pyrroline-5-carboxylate dehydrogenase
MDPDNARRMEAALAKVRASFGTTYPLIIGGRRITDGDAEPSINPAKPSEVVGRVVQCTKDQALEAIRIADQTFHSWRKVPVEERADYLFRAAELMRERKFELAAVMVYEVSKSWAEADADIAELIDFTEYYAREALRIGGQRGGQVPGERFSRTSARRGRGHPPWNFRPRSWAGMALAAVANAVPGQAGLHGCRSSAQFMEIWRVKLPAGVVSFVRAERQDRRLDRGSPAGALHRVHGLKSQAADLQRAAKCQGESG